jgi:SIR2-like domain
MKTIKDFPFDPIADHFRKGICIPFLGAGASSFPRGPEAKPPTASALAWELAEEWNHPQYQIFRAAAKSKDPKALERSLRARIDCENLMLVSSWVEHSRGDRPHLDEKLRKHLAEKPLSPNALHDLLARVAQQRPMAMITTNYDDLIERALVAHGVPFDLFVVAIDRGAMLFRRSGQVALEPVTGQQELLNMDDGAPVRLKRTALFKIHGHIDSTRETDDTFVITEEDYVSFLSRMGPENSLIPGELVALMRSGTLLLLGYGLRDWNFRVLLDRLNRSRVQPKRSYAVAYDIDPAEGELWEARKVAVFRADLNRFVPRLGAKLKNLSLSSP